MPNKTKERHMNLLNDMCAADYIGSIITGGDEINKELSKYIN
ncbi:hypothetical protein P700755_002849 [Psychroflexus torquis ATCC 700755]|uniref:Uncharacterized protein n=1 Tax=Psychroflexus torquis (strain ATCC 700755 / CIP 106069 / ACAM 623) TaxID=313595 RepID=K4IID1_PSYTT|nr:hypothetical protein [Psychroflexus torquis]AFU69563.1 hypothetical protein P700755_002849 [Psychroflexus torquis ATCC 700755]